MGKNSRKTGNGTYVINAATASVPFVCQSIVADMVQATSAANVLSVKWNRVKTTCT